jgi:hypothetical protein
MNFAVLSKLRIGHFCQASPEYRMRKSVSYQIRSMVLCVALAGPQRSGYCRSGHSLAMAQLFLSLIFHRSFHLTNNDSEIYLHARVRYY